MEIFDLTDEQKKAFTKLKRAYKDCQNVGIYFANRYGNLHAYNKKFIIEFGTEEMLNSEYRLKVCDAKGGDVNSFTIVNEWADDDIQHAYGLTKSGFNLVRGKN